MSFIDIQLNPAKATTVYFILGCLTFIRTGGLDYPLCKCNTIISKLSKNKQKIIVGILPSWGCKARETIVNKCKLVV